TGRHPSLLRDPPVGRSAIAGVHGGRAAAGPYRLTWTVSPLSVRPRLSSGGGERAHLPPGRQLPATTRAGARTYGCAQPEEALLDGADRAGGGQAWTTQSTPQSRCPHPRRGCRRTEGRSAGALRRRARRTSRDDLPPARRRARSCRVAVLPAL